MTPKPTRILVVATSPPPYGGQAMMVQTLLNAKFDNIELHHVRMSFSSSMKSVGRFEIKKVFHMIDVVLRAVIKRLKYKTDYLYYVPGGSGKAPVLRDIFILFFLRSLSKKVIFHFHAAGVSEVVEKLPKPLKQLALNQYSAPDLALFLSGRNPDSAYFKPEKSIVVANGMADAALAYMPIKRVPSEVTRLLFVGVLQETKGVMVLLQAIAQLKKAGYTISATLMGEFSSEEFRNQALGFCKESGIDSMVHFPGVLLDDVKWEHFAKADIFCFPSFFESESFGNVLVEAMMFELPLVSTQWRGIPDIVSDRENGYLVPIKNSTSLAKKIELLIENPEIRKEMGINGRRKYLNNYKLEHFVERVQNAFQQVIA